MSSGDRRSSTPAQQHRDTRMTNSSCFVSCWLQQRLDPRWIDAVSVSQANQLFVPKQSLRALPGLMRVMLDDPRPQLPPNLCLADTLDHVDACGAQDSNAFAIHTRMRISHSNHDPRDPTAGNRA